MPQGAAPPTNRLRIVQSHEVPSRATTTHPRNRVKEHLTAQEMTRLLAAARRGRHGLRDYTMLLLAWRHGLRVTELIRLKVLDLNVDAREIQVRRLKGSLSTHHELLADEVKALKTWLRRRAKSAGARSPALFLTERGEGFTRYGFNYLVKTIGVRAGFAFTCYPHMLRHSCGFHLADGGRDAFRIAGYLGHRNIQNSLRYVHTSAAQFRGIWGDV
jgi:site-specific recombinase XerD